MKIEKIKAYECFDSRGRPTVACLFYTERGVFKSLVPSGASTGTKEAVELRDNDPKRFQGLGVTAAVRNILEIIQPEVVGKSWSSQREFDEELCRLDGTENKSNLGANAILACSLCFLRAMAAEHGIEDWEHISRLSESTPSLPVPTINIINGGAHADNQLDFQEFMIVPSGFNCFRESIRAGAEVFMSLKSLLKKRGLSVSVGDEGGFAPRLADPFEALDLIVDAVELAGYKLGSEISLALDIAASELFSNGEYVLKKSSSEKLSSEALEEIYFKIMDKYPVVSIEDPFGEADYGSWKRFFSRFHNSLTIIGDDLICTNPRLIKEALDQGAINGALIKLNQIGTVSETLDAIHTARAGGCKISISHRSGDTEDPIIADLAVGVGSEFIKTGSVCRGERTCKYNRLIEIEHIHGLNFRGF